MSGTLVAVASALAGLLAAWAGVVVARDRRTGRALLVGVGVVEVAVLVVVGAAVAAMAGGSVPRELATTIAYLVVTPLLLPAATFWTLTDRSRPSTLVLVVAAFAVAVVLYRTWELFEVLR